jgi:CrcB protein
VSAAFDLRALLAIALGGGLGSMTRYAFAVLVTARTGPGFPWATLLINLIGSFAIGIVSELMQTRSVGMPNIPRLFWMVGVLGGFTTFSTFSLDMLQLAASDRAPLSAALYAIASVVVGLLLANLGVAAVRLLQPA